MPYQHFLHGLQTKHCMHQKHNEHPRLCDFAFDLAWKCLHTQCWWLLGIFSSKVVAHTDLVFGMPSGFINRSVRAKLQVFLANATVIICATPIDPKLYFCILMPVTSKSRSSQKWLSQLMHSCQMHPRCRSLACTDNTHISIFFDDIKTQWSRSGWRDFCFVIRVC